MDQSQRVEFLRRLRAKNPNPRSELNYNSPFELLIAVILSAQATDISVNRATARLYLRANTPEDILALGIEGLTEYIRSIGLFRTKAANISKTCAILIERHGGEVPCERAALEELPGVGRKTANVVLNSAFGWPTIAIDTHIFRICNRTGFAPGKNVTHVERELLRVVPEEFKIGCHHWLILHGRYTCTAHNPRCGSCIVEDLCDFENKSKLIQAPPSRHT